MNSANRAPVRVRAQVRDHRPPLPAATGAKGATAGAREADLPGAAEAADGDAVSPRMKASNFNCTALTAPPAGPYGKRPPSSWSPMKATTRIMVSRRTPR